MPFNPSVAIVRTKLKDIFSKTWFDFSALDLCMQVTGSKGDSKTLKALRALHCIHYSQMDTDLRKWLIDTCIEMVKPDQTDIDFSDLEPMTIENLIR